MKISARILCDSITDGGSRLITWELTYPRFMHAELMTHRVLSRNLASSRAIPCAKMRQMVIDHPVIPLEWGANQKGMQATREVEDTEACRAWWLAARDLMTDMHWHGERLGLHKQIVNRLIEPWLYAVGVVTGTDFAGLYHQRRHKDAEPHFHALADCMWELHHEHMPTYTPPGAWHLPFIYREDAEQVLGRACESHSLWSGAWGEAESTLPKISAARCARVSYLNHEGKRSIPSDLELWDKLVGSDVMHASPFEHPCRAVGGRKRIKNLEGWQQLRDMMPGEAGPPTDDRCERCGCWGGRHVTTCPAAEQTAQ